MPPLSTVTVPFKVQIDGQTAASWGEILAQFEDASIYQSWAYGACRWGERNLSHFVLSREGQVVAAAQLRLARLPLLPAGVAYLRWGPLCQKKGTPLEAPLVQETIARLRDEYARRRGLSLQIIPNAYAGDTRGVIYEDALKQAGFGPETEVAPYQTVVVDLGDSPEAIRKRLDGKWRNQLNRSEKNGLTFEVSDGADAYQEFVRLYEVMWERKQFETSVSVEEFGRIQAALTGPAKMQTFLARKDGVPVGALVCSLMGNSAIYLLGATNDQARELKAAYFLQWQAMLWLKERGARWYDLGGIDPLTNPGGYHFKSGFGGAEMTQLPLCSREGNWLSAGATTLIKWRRQRHASAKPVAATAAPS